MQALLSDFVLPVIASIFTASITTLITLYSRERYHARKAEEEWISHLLGELKKFYEETADLTIRERGDEKIPRGKDYRDIEMLDEVNHAIEEIKELTWKPPSRIEEQHRDVLSDLNRLVTGYKDLVDPPEDVFPGPVSYGDLNTELHPLYYQIEEKLRRLPRK